MLTLVPASCATIPKLSRIRPTALDAEIQEIKALLSREYLSNEERHLLHVLLFEINSAMETPDVGGEAV